MNDITVNTVLRGSEAGKVQCAFAGESGGQLWPRNLSVTTNKKRRAYKAGVKSELAERPDVES